MSDPMLGLVTSMVTGAAAAHAAATARAIKASGAIVRMEPREFEMLLTRSKGALVVTAPSGSRGRKTQYLMSHRGFIFHCISEERLNLPADAEVIASRKIWIP